jgi:hypothetical protein
MAKLKLNITKEIALDIMSMHRKSIDLRVISKKYNFSATFISMFTRAFNGNEITLKTLHEDHQVLIKQISPFYNKNKTKQNNVKNEVCYYKLLHELFVDKVCESLNFHKTLSILKEVKQQVSTCNHELILGSDDDFYCAECNKQM